MSTSETMEMAADGAMTVMAAAQYLGVGRSTIYELLSAGSLRTCSVGRRRLIPRRELQRFLAERLAAASE